MKDLVVEIAHSIRTWPIFVLAVLLTLVLCGIIGLMILMMQLQPGFMGMAHFTDPHHRTHELTFGLLFGIAVVGLVAQLRQPLKNVAGMLMALFPWAALLLAGLLSADVFRTMVINPAGSVATVVVLTTLLHPSGRSFVRSFSTYRINWLMLALVAVAAVPLLVFATTNIRLQATIADSHAALGHYAFMAAFAFTVIGTGVLTSMRPVGWKVTAWVSAALPVLLGLISLLYPDNSSSLGTLWSVAAIAWGIAFLAASIRSGSAVAPGDATAWPVGGSTWSQSAWVTTLRIVVLVPILLVVANTAALLAGAGGPGGHAPKEATSGSESGANDTDGVVEIGVIADDFEFDPNEITVTAGEEVTVSLTSVDILHDLVIDEFDARAVARPGRTSTTTFRADRPGQYTYYCSVEGHRQLGMEGTLIVESRGPEQATPEEGAKPARDGGHRPPAGFSH